MAALALCIDGHHRALGGLLFGPPGARLWGLVRRFMFRRFERPCGLDAASQRVSDGDGGLHSRSMVSSRLALCIRLRARGPCHCGGIVGERAGSHRQSCVDELLRPRSACASARSTPRKRKMASASRCSHRRSQCRPQSAADFGEACRASRCSHFFCRACPIMQRGGMGGMRLIVEVPGSSHIVLAQSRAFPLQLNQHPLASEDLVSCFVLGRPRGFWTASDRMRHHLQR